MHLSESRLVQGTHRRITTPDAACRTRRLPSTVLLSCDVVPRYSAAEPSREGSVAVPSSGGPEPTLSTFADRINYLFATHGPSEDDEEEYTGKYVVATLRAKGFDISESHLSELRRGLKTNPTLRVLEGLSTFFGVRVSFLLGDPHATREVFEQVELRRAMRDAKVRDVATRVAGLAPSQRHAMNRLLTDLLREHADAEDPGTPDS